MKNKNVGFLIVGISVFIGIIISLFNSALKKIVAETCTHGESCQMYDTLAMQTNLSLAIAGLVFFIGVFLIFSKESEKVIVKKVRESVKKKKIDLGKLDSEELKVLKILKREGGNFFQKNLMEELKVGKVKMTRLMDKLEAKQIIERKRKGMNNLIVLK
tara:strand:+ start:279 stop:755 length:477 start_codon:yes stop_codon:yes gene_type:complete